MILVQKIRKTGDGLRPCFTYIGNDRVEAFAWWKKKMKEESPDTSDNEISVCWTKACFMLGKDCNWTWTEV